MKIGNIRFKAKRLDNGKWVEGYFYAECGNAYIIEDRQSESILNRNEAHQVDPLTVCQFTGLKDCEGNEIWEGDIISSPHFERVATVKWDDSLCGFKCSDVTGNINFIFTAIAHCSEWSIVGNKFDKKYLMEKNMFEDIVAEGNIVVIDNDWIVLCKRWRPEYYNLFCYLYLHKEYKNLMVGSHFTMTEDKKKSTRLATNEERLMLFEEMFKYGITFDKYEHRLIGKLVGV